MKVSLALCEGTGPRRKPSEVQAASIACFLVQGRTGECEKRYNRCNRDMFFQATGVSDFCRSRCLQAASSSCNSWLSGLWSTRQVFPPFCRILSRLLGPLVCMRLQKKDLGAVTASPSKQDSACGLDTDPLEHMTWTQVNDGLGRRSLNMKRLPACSRTSEEGLKESLEHLVSRHGLTALIAMTLVTQGDCMRRKASVLSHSQ